MISTVNTRIPAVMDLYYYERDLTVVEAFVAQMPPRLHEQQLGERPINHHRPTEGRQDYNRRDDLVDRTAHSDFNRFLTIPSSSLNDSHTPCDEQNSSLGNEKDDNDCESDDMLPNKYFESLRILETNQVSSDRLTKAVACIERERVSIALELESIDDKSSSMLAEHGPASQKAQTEETCLDDSIQSFHRLLGLEWTDEDPIDCIEMPFASDLSSIHNCPSHQHEIVRAIIGINEDRDDAPTEKVLDAKSGIDWVLQGREDSDPFTITGQSLDSDDLSDVSGLSDFCAPGILKVDSTDKNDVALIFTFSPVGLAKSVATYERTGQKSHLYSFPDVICLLEKQSQDLCIPSSAENDDDDDLPCLFGVKSRSKDDECNACVIS